MVTYKTWEKEETPKCPVDNSRNLWPVMNRSTSGDKAISTEHDTPVWFCPDHGTIYIRKEQ